jgi:DEAD/DEAH box helicase domain-containing protein
MQRFIYNRRNELAKTFLKNKIQTIVFARSRVRVEIILSHIQEIVKKEIGAKSVSHHADLKLADINAELQRVCADNAENAAVS